MAKPTEYPCRMQIKITTDSNPRLLQIRIGIILNSEEEYLECKRDVIKTLLVIPKDRQTQMLCHETMELLRKVKSGKVPKEADIISGLGFLFTDVTFGNGKKTIRLEISWTTNLNWDYNETTEGVSSLCGGCHEIFAVEKLSSCAVCKHVCYCSRACQKKDWKKHKLICEKC